MAQVTPLGRAHSLAKDGKLGLAKPMWGKQYFFNKANKTSRPHIFLKGVERTVDKILGLDSHHVGEGSGEKAVAEDKLYIDRCIGCKYWLKDIIEQHVNLKKRHKLYLRCASQNLHS